jgi:hypothetical protein
VVEVVLVTASPDHPAGDRHPDARGRAGQYWNR